MGWIRRTIEAVVEELKKHVLASIAALICTGIVAVALFGRDYVLWWYHKPSALDIEAAVHREYGVNPSIDYIYHYYSDLSTLVLVHDVKGQYIRSFAYHDGELFDSGKMDCLLQYPWGFFDPDYGFVEDPYFTSREKKYLFSYDVIDETAYVLDAHVGIYDLNCKLQLGAFVSRQHSNSRASFSYTGYFDDNVEIPALSRLLTEIIDERGFPPYMGGIGGFNKVNAKRDQLDDSPLPVIFDDAQEAAVCRSEKYQLGMLRSWNIVPIIAFSRDTELGYITEIVDIAREDTIAAAFITIDGGSAVYYLFVETNVWDDDRPDQVIIIETDLSQRHPKSKQASFHSLKDDVSYQSLINQIKHKKTNSKLCELESVISGHFLLKPDS